MSSRNDLTFKMKPKLSLLAFLVTIGRKGLPTQGRNVRRNRICLRWWKPTPLGPTCDKARTDFLPMLQCQCFVRILKGRVTALKKTPDLDVTSGLSELCA